MKPSFSVNAKYHGVPQSRKRLIMVASKTGIYQFPPHEPIIGWYEAIADLLPDCPDTHLADWQKKKLENFNIPIHRGGLMGNDLRTKSFVEPQEPSFAVTAQMCVNSRVTAFLVNEDSKLKAGIPADRPSPTVMTTGSGGSMRAVLVDNFACDFIPAGNPFPTLRSSKQGAIKALLPRGGARKESFRPFTEDEPAPTLRAMAEWGGAHVFDAIDGVTIKKLTPRCLARLMSVPDDYLLPDKTGLAVKVLGNGVPPEMMYRIAMELH